jgi:hypothetical protein
MDTLVTPEPRPLPTHVATSADEGQLTGLLDISRCCAVIERVDHLGVTQRTPGGDAVTQTPAQQRAHLINQTGCEHGIGTHRQSGV